MAEAAPHHLELIYQLLVQGTHFWVHQLLVHSQTDSQDVNLCENQFLKTSADEMKNPVSMRKNEDEVVAHVGLQTNPSFGKLNARVSPALLLPASCQQMFFYWIEII